MFYTEKENKNAVNYDLNTIFYIKQGEWKQILAAENNMKNFYITRRLAKG